MTAATVPGAILRPDRDMLNRLGLHRCRTEMPHRNDSSDHSARVLQFVRPGQAWREPRPSPHPIEDLAKFQNGDGEIDDYRHRQRTNLAAFTVCILLVIIGVWLAVKIAELRRDQDCVLAGRRNCAQISIDSAR